MDAGCTLAGVPSVLRKDREVRRHRGGWTGGRGEQARRRGCCARDCLVCRPRTPHAEPAHAFIPRRVSHQSAQGQPVREGGERITRLAGRPKRPNPPVRAAHRHPQGNRIWGASPQYGGGCPPRPPPPTPPKQALHAPPPSQQLHTPPLPPTHLNARHAIGGAFNGGPPGAQEADHGVAWRPRRQAWRPSRWRQAWRPPAGDAPPPGRLGRRKERCGGKWGGGRSLQTSSVGCGLAAVGGGGGGQPRGTGEKTGRAVERAGGRAGGQAGGGRVWR